MDGSAMGVSFWNPRTPKAIKNEPRSRNPSAKVQGAYFKTSSPKVLESETVSVTDLWKQPTKATKNELTCAISLLTETRLYTRELEK